MSINEKDLVEVIAGVDKHLKEFDELNETCDEMIRRADASKKLRKLQESVDADLDEGSVESLLRAKEKVNILLDNMIRRALDSAV